MTKVRKIGILVDADMEKKKDLCKNLEESHVVCKAWDNAQGTFIVVEIKVHDYIYIIQTLICTYVCVHMCIPTPLKNTAIHLRKTKHTS